MKPATYNRVNARVLQLRAGGIKHEDHQDHEAERGRAEMFEPIGGDAERIVTETIDSAICVHSALGPGLLESVYEACLCHELARRGLSFERQVASPVVYQRLRLDAGLRLDLVVERCVIIELKAVEKLLAIHEAQVLTYLKLSGLRIALLINFNSTKLKDGLRRFVRWPSEREGTRRPPRPRRKKNRTYRRPGRF